MLDAKNINGEEVSRYSYLCGGMLENTSASTHGLITGEIKRGEGYHGACYSN
jgi:hypothetical protein